MAKQYRKNNIVTAMYGGRSVAGRDTLDPKKELQGMTAQQHCEKLIAKRKSGHFKKVSENEDVCMLYSCNYWGECYEAAEYSYHYDVCLEIEFTGTVNGKATTAKDLAKLKGGERVIISANQEVTWSANDNKKLEKVAINATTYSFTMPKSGSFSIKATGKCDPNASKSITVAIPTVVNSKPTSNNNEDKKLAHALSFAGGLIKGMNDVQTRAFAANVAQTESAGTFNLQIENKFGYFGLYQFGASALAEVGLIDRTKYNEAVKKYGGKLSNGSDPNVHKSFLNDPNNWVSGESKSNFLNDRAKQDRAFVTLSNKNLSYASPEAKKAIENNAEKTVAYLKMAHLKGSGNASKGIVNPNYDVVDGNKTSMQKYGQGAANDLTRYTQVVQTALAKKQQGK